MICFDDFLPASEAKKSAFMIFEGPRGNFLESLRASFNTDVSAVIDINGSSGLYMDLLALLTEVDDEDTTINFICLVVLCRSEIMSL